MNVDEKSKNSELLRIHVGHLMVIPDDIHKVNLLTVQRVRMGIGMRRKKKKKVKSRKEWEKSDNYAKADF